MPALECIIHDRKSKTKILRIYFKICRDLINTLSVFITSLYPRQPSGSVGKKEFQPQQCPVSAEILIHWACKAEIVMGTD
jgi:hypothetical protein